MFQYDTIVHSELFGGTICFESIWLTNRFGLCLDLPFGRTYVAFGPGQDVSVWLED